MIRVDPASPVPAYEQISHQISAAASAGELPAGTRLPTVRQLAGDLGLATNTVARAYRELELRGVVQTRGRNGTVVRGSAQPADDDETRAAAVLLARAAQRRGMALADAIAALQQAW